VIKRNRRKRKWMANGLYCRIGHSAQWCVGEVLRPSRGCAFLPKMGARNAKENLSQLDLAIVSHAKIIVLRKWSICHLRLNCSRLLIDIRGMRSV